MKEILIAPRRWVALVFVSLAFTGCATQEKPLYYWGDYQPAVYSYFKGEGSPQEQIGKLEETQGKAQSQGAALPPGFHAHLGLLYVQVGDTAKAQRAFQTEKARFPESATYMDFLMRKSAKLTPVAQPAAKPAAPTKPSPKAATPPSGSKSQ